MTRLFGDIPFNEAGWPNTPPGAGGGSVTSVALPVSVFSVADPTGAVVGTFINQSANNVFAGPTSGGAATPTFRALVAADVSGTVSGTPTGAKFLRDDWSWQTATAVVSDGNKGDITVSSSGAVWTINNDSVTFAKMQNVSTSTVMGRATAATGDIESLAVGGTTGLEAASATLRIAAQGVTFARIVDTSTNTVLGRATAGTGSVESLAVGGSTGLEAASATLRIAAQGVTFARIVDLNASSLIGRRSGSGTGVSENVTLGGPFTMSAAAVLDLVSGGTAFTKLEALAASGLVGRRSGSGTGACEAVTLGNGLTMSSGSALSVSQGAAIADADGSLSDATTKVNAILARMRAFTPIIST